MDSFATLIKKAREAYHLRRKDVASQVLKKDGLPISMSYLNGLEQGQWLPPVSLIPQFAQVLKLPEDILYFASGLLPPDIQEMGATHQQIVSAFTVLRQTLPNNTCGPENQAGEATGEEGSIIGTRIGKQAIAKRIRSVDKRVQPVKINSFAGLITQARKAWHLRQEDVANQVLKINGQPIAISYLSDLEHGRRKPPTRLIPLFAQVLNLSEDVLYFALGLLPPDIRETGATYQHVVEGLAHLRHRLIVSYRWSDAQTSDLPEKVEDTSSRGIGMNNQATVQLVLPEVMSGLEMPLEPYPEEPDIQPELEALLATPVAKKMDGFTTLITKARQAHHLRQEDVANQILKKDGHPIVISYFSDIERGRREISTRLIPQLAQALRLPKDLLYFTLGILPPDIKETEATPLQIAEALENLRQTLAFSHHGLEEQAG